jgi:uncharacterized protein YlaI
MAQTKEGAIKIAAKKIGIPVDEYNNNISNGLKWCSMCKSWVNIDYFSNNSKKLDGKAINCKSCQKKYYKRYYIPKNRVQQGPLPHPERDGDIRQARARINVLVKTGKIPKPNDLPCKHCGHIFKKGEKRHEYHHHNGYSSGSHLDVIPLCTDCHHKEHPIG